MYQPMAVPDFTATTSDSSGQQPRMLRYEASMVLAGVGDAIGYKNSEWEFCSSGEVIHKELAKLSGLEGIVVDRDSACYWRVSDDTVMHIATAKALVSGWKDREGLYQSLAKCYKECAPDLDLGRAPGTTCLNSIDILRPGEPKGYYIPFNHGGGGCGAAMRAAPIGLLYPEPKQIHDLIAVGVESGRMTHNHPTGYLGSLASALFVSYGIQGKPLREWGAGLIQALDMAWEYVEQSGRDVEENRTHWTYFKDKWTDYLKLRGILDGHSEPTFPEKYGVEERDVFYGSLSYDGWGGASGHDAPMIAYDALLSSGDSWSELCYRGMLHGGDSDSTGIIAASCWGARYGFQGVPEQHYKNLEYVDQLRELATKLFKSTLLSI